MEEKQKNLSSKPVSTSVWSTAEEIIYPYVNRLIRQAESILDLDPAHSEDEIFQVVIQNVATSLALI